MKYALSLITFSLLIFFHSCEQDTKDITPSLNIEESIQAATTIDELIQLQLDFNMLTHEQAEFFFDRIEYFSNLKPTDGKGNDEDLKTFEECAGLIFYPNGNDDAPCLVKHKIHYLNTHYDACIAEGYTTVVFYFKTIESATSTVVCSSTVQGGIQSPYNYECLLPNEGNYIMDVYILAYGGRKDYKYEVICGDYYCCDC